VLAHKGRFVLKLEGVDSIDDAERYRGLELRIAEEDLAPLPEGSYYHHELRDLRVEDPQGVALGTVADLLETGAGTILVVRGPRASCSSPRRGVREAGGGGGGAAGGRAAGVPAPSGAARAH